MWDSSVKFEGSWWLLQVKFKGGIVRVNLDLRLSQRWLGIAHGLGTWFVVAHGIVPWYCMWWSIYKAWGDSIVKVGLWWVVTSSPRPDGRFWPCNEDLHWCWFSPHGVSRVYCVSILNVACNVYLLAYCYVNVARFNLTNRLWYQVICGIFKLLEWS